MYFKSNGIRSSHALGEAALILDSCFDEVDKSCITDAHVTYSYEKLVLIASSRDVNLDSSFPATWSYEDLLTDHLNFWKEKWKLCDIDEEQARFPWMTSFDGSEQCETWDIGCSEIHITADVVYAIDNYCKKYNDTDFYVNYASELYVETARYWISRYTYDANHQVANLLFCKGPDEYCGITTNNLFTNVMVQNNLSLAIDAAHTLKDTNPALYAKLNITDSEIQSWEELKRDIPWPKDPMTGHLTTDDTFHLLESVDIARIKPDDSASYHTTCFDRLQRYKVVKQADVLLLMTRLKDLFSAEEKMTAWNDFEPLCLHDSTLSFASHSLFAVQNNLQDKATYYFNKALFLDIYDVMNNTGKEGLHMAGMGEIWQAALYMNLLNLKA